MWFILVGYIYNDNDFFIFVLCIVNVFVWFFEENRFFVYNDGCGGVMGRYVVGEFKLFIVGKLKLFMSLIF